MSIHIRNALVGVLVTTIFSFALAFAMASVGAKAGAEVPLIGAMLGSLVFYLLWNLSGNRKILKASQEQRDQAVALISPQGQAMLYVIRKGFVAKAAGMSISIDDTLRAHLKSPQFTCFAVTPGTHELSAAFGGGAGAQSRKQTQQISLEEGKVMGVLMMVKMGAVQGSIAFEMLSGVELQQAIRSMTMVVPVEA
jgi:hypothetical protein